MSKVRLNVKKDLQQNLPITAIAIINEMFRDRTVKNLSFSITKLPPTVNHMYKRSRGKTYLSEEAVVFRNQVCFALNKQSGHFKTNSIFSIILLFESPKWVTKKSTVREMDADNRIKSMLDAIQQSIGLQDERIWEIHCWKIASKVEKTTVYLFELGDVVDFYL